MTIKCLKVIIATIGFLFISNMHLVAYLSLAAVCITVLC